MTVFLEQLKYLMKLVSSTCEDHLLCNYHFFEVRKANEFNHEVSVSPEDQLIVLVLPSVLWV